MQRANSMSRKRLIVSGPQYDATVSDVWRQFAVCQLTLVYLGDSGPRQVLVSTSQFHKIQIMYTKHKIRVASNVSTHTSLALPELVSRVLNLNLTSQAWPPEKADFLPSFLRFAAVRNVAWTFRQMRQCSDMDALIVRQRPAHCARVASYASLLYEQ